MIHGLIIDDTWVPMKIYRVHASFKIAGFLCETQLAEFPYNVRSYPTSFKSSCTPNTI